MKGSVIGYTILIVVYIASVVIGGEYGIVWPVTGAIIGAGIAATVGKINFLGTTIVFLFLSFIFPLLVGYILGTHSGLDSPMQGMLNNYDWVRAILPWVAALATQAAVVWVRKKRV